MNRRWLTRALIALAVPALTVAALANPASAAGGAKVPTIDAVAKTYPHLKGGTATESDLKVYGPGKKCNTSKVVKGASGRSASYAPDLTSSDPSAYGMTGERPMVMVQAYKFPTTKAAITYLRGFMKQAKKCPVTKPGGGTGGGSKCKSSTKKIGFKLGDERWGFQIRSTCASEASSSVFNTLFSRKGRFIVYTSAMAMGTDAPSIPKSVQLTATALKSVG